MATELFINTFGRPPQTAGLNLPGNYYSRTPDFIQFQIHSKSKCEKESCCDLVLPNKHESLPRKALRSIVWRLENTGESLLRNLQ